MAAGGAGSVTPAYDCGVVAAARGGRKPRLWDNYPVNDGVMVPRRSCRPVLGQDGEGAFVAATAMVDEDRNATDRIVGAVLARLDS